MRRLVCLMLLMFAVTAGAEDHVSGTARRIVLPAESSTGLATGLTNGLVLGPRLALLEDRDASLDAEQAFAKALGGEFKPAVNADQSLGVTSSVWWVYFTLENPRDSRQSLVLRQLYPLIDYVDLWEDGGTASGRRQSGDMLPFSSRDVKLNELAFNIDMPPRASKRFLMRFQTAGSMSIRLRLIDAESLVAVVADERLLQGIFFGWLIALALYNLFLYVLVRDFSYFLYVVYAVTFGLFIACLKGLAAQYLWPESPWWGNHSLLIFWALVVAATLAFSRNFLNFKHYLPRVNLMSNGLAILALTCAVASLFVAYNAVIKVLFLFAPIAYSLILYAAYKGVRRGYAPAGYFLAAWLILLVGAIVATLMAAGLLPQNYVMPAHIMQLGAMLEMILLSIALASRIRNLEKDSLTDSLTRLPNRRFFDEELARAFSYARRNQQPLSLMVLDVDKFKQFNDSFGHDKGDLVLTQVSEIMSHSARATDYVCRYGGEEFAIILPGTSEVAAREIAERIREAVRMHALEGQRITISIGVSNYPTCAFEDEQELFKAADDALYHAKDMGRNRVVIYSKAIPLTAVGDQQA